jgi:hypothetical protein
MQTQYSKDNTKALKGSSMKSWVHAVLFAVYPVLLLYSFNMHEVSAVEVLTPALFLGGLTGLVLAVARLFSIHQKISVVLSVFWFLFLCYGYIYEALHLPRHIYGWVLCGGLLSSTILYAFFSGKYLERIGAALSSLGGVLILMTLINIGYNLATKDIYTGEKIERPADYALERPMADPDQRDIYYLIFDRYASEDNLEKYYDYNNTEFTKDLEEKGFYVAPHSYANYPKTIHSISSSLNMTYLTPLANTMGTTSNDWGPLFRMVEDHEVWRFLRSKGYQYHHMGSFSKESEYNTLADVNVTYNAFPLMGFYTSQEFLTVLYKTTMLFPIGMKFALESYNFDKMHWQRVSYKFDELEKIAALPEPTFVYAHFLIPHPPYVFAEDGAFKIHAREEAPYMYVERYDAEAYKAQVTFVNTKIQAFVDHALSVSSRPPIIIIQSDEGPWPERYPPIYREFNWREATDEELDEKSGILSAYYLPDIEPEVLYPSISPVNTFRVIFNQYFNATFEMLPDETYAYRDEDHPYDLFNITNRLPHNKVLIPVEAE